MSALTVLLLDAGVMQLLSADSDEPLASAAWNPDAPTADIARAVASLAPLARDKGPVVVVIGLGLLDVTQPDLPPLDGAAQRALLVRDADRYFPIDGAVAVSLALPFAFAVRGERYAAWVSAVESLAPVRAVTTVPECLMRSGTDGVWIVPAGTGERGVVRVEHGRLREVRRARADASPARNTVIAHVGTPPLAIVARSASSMSAAPLDAMLLDPRMHARFSAARRARRLQSVAMLVVAVVVLGWAFDRWRARTLVEADRVLADLTRAAAPAQRASARVRSGMAELSMISAYAPAPSAVLARIGELLPRDAFVQRLEWDGTTWRIDGSANDAPALIPLLDGDTLFANVRSAAATSRFVDMGRQRESFSIAFELRAPGGARGTP